MIGKKEAFEFILARVDSVRLVINSTAEGVQVPANAVDANGVVALDVGMNMAVPIRNFTVDEGGVSGDFSFNRQPHWVALPWKSIFAVLAAHEAQFVWMDDAPAALKDKKDTTEKPTDKPADKPDKPRGGLRSV